MNDPVERYKQMMAELGVSRGALEDGEHIDIDPAHAGVMKTRPPRFLTDGPGVEIPPTPDADVPEHLQSDSRGMRKKVRSWWEGLSPEERAIEGAKRSRNAKLRGKQRPTPTGSPEPPAQTP